MRFVAVEIIGSKGKWGIFDKRNRALLSGSENYFKGAGAKAAAVARAKELSDELEERLAPRPRAQGGMGSQSGNIFFVLFGAVALVGVVGAATTSLMRGPLASAVLMNRSMKADAQMNVAGRLALGMAASAATPDCDIDGVNEPLPPVAWADGPAGAGKVPVGGGGPEIDPWGTPYAYCAFDHVDFSPVACPGLLAGEDPANGILIAVLSAGPDKSFQSSCAAAPVYLTKAGDDLVQTFTPAEAGAITVTGGVWVLDDLDPTIATTEKDLAVSTDLAFSSSSAVSFTGATASFDVDSALDLAGLFMLPDQTTMPGCDAAEQGGLRRLSGAGSESLEICNGTDWETVGIKTFLGLDDSPDAYAGTAGQVLRVNATEDALEFHDLLFTDLADAPDYTGQAGKTLLVNATEDGLEYSSFDFLSLTDTPDDYTGNGGKLLSVKADGSGLEFTDLSGTSAILDNWPDAIKCSGTSGAIWLDLSYNETSSSTVFYGTRGHAVNSRQLVQFNLDGSWFAASGDAAWLLSCNNKSIAQHYTAGTAYHFTGPSVTVPQFAVFDFTNAASTFTPSAVYNGITGLTVAAGYIALPAGTFLFEYHSTVATNLRTWGGASCNGAVLYAFPYVNSAYNYTTAATKNVCVAGVDGEGTLKITKL